MAAVCPLLYEVLFFFTFTGEIFHLDWSLWICFRLFISVIVAFILVQVNNNYPNDWKESEKNHSDNSLKQNRKETLGQIVSEQI